MRLALRGERVTKVLRGDAIMAIVLYLLVLLALLGPGAAAASPAPVSAEDLARRIEARHRTVRDLTARFVQTYRSGLVGREIVESGTLSLKRPGRMRWEYREPERKTFVSDGQKYYFYVPADRQVVVRDQAGDRSVTTLLLTGQADILAEFAVALEAPEGGRARLRLTPRRENAEVQQVVLEVDERNMIRALRVRDAQGSESRFQFEAIRENVGLEDRLFRFDVPRGVEVVKG
jgi:outer membrane lipoprotein carrier protein